MMTRYGDLGAGMLRSQERFMKISWMSGILQGEMLEKLRGAPNGQASSAHAENPQARAEALRVLHLQEIHLLKKGPRVQGRERMRQGRIKCSRLSLLSINAIASGLRHHGAW
jgi:hypothetical protein